MVSGVPIGVIGWESENWEPCFNQTIAKELRHSTCLMMFTFEDSCSLNIDPEF